MLNKTTKDFKKSLKNHVGTIMRVILAATAMVVSMSLYVSSIANAAILNPEVVIEDEHIRLGDLFDGMDANRNAGYILGPAPAPGENMVLGTSTLKKLARAFRLEWQPDSRYEQVVISRAATVVPAEDIHKAINAAIHREGYADNYKVAVHNLLSDVTLPGYQEASINVDDIKVDPSSNTFRATVKLPANGKIVETIRVIGSMEYMVDVPVLNTSVRRGDVITKSNITMVSIPESQVTNDMILSANKLLGKTPRRVLNPQQAVKLTDVAMPEIIERGERITMILNNGNMHLTAMGKALENGAEGDVIRVVNLASNRVLDAHVTADNMVEILPQ